jgi:hypothetical protein
MPCAPLEVRGSRPYSCGMSSPEGQPTEAASPAALAEVYCRQLRRELRKSLAAAGLAPIQAGELLGRSRVFGPRLLSGRSRLQLPDVFDLLLALELKPDRFFRWAFPVALTVEQALALAAKRRRTLTWQEEAYGKEHEEERATLVSTIWDGTEWAEDLLRVLRLHLLEANVPQRTVADWLEVSLAASYRLLGGARVLTFEQLFRLLANAGIEPSRLFLDLATPIQSPEDRAQQRERQDWFEVSARMAYDQLRRGRPRKPIAITRPKPKVPKVPYEP